ncbi:MAG TPA: NADH-quinone oxidoreductase subunit N [Roseiflexaceae bacterium]|nr:NADH-quinone oxidoreductase subunit N [Roseiflexaceae bacterium]
MTATDLLALLPLIALGALALALMVVNAFRRTHALNLTLTLVGLGASLATLPVAARAAPRQVGALLVVDAYALFYMGLLIAATMAVATLSYGYLERPGRAHDKYYILLVLAAAGGATLVASNHFVTFFLGVDLLSVALYALVAYLRERERSIEAGLKYLILAAAASAFLLFGMALIYAELGAMAFDRMAVGGAPGALLLTGLAMIVIGVGFKLAVVPFHMWTPDVYEGAPAPVTAFVATVSKGAMFALLLRFFVLLGLHAYSSLLLVLALIAVASMFAGNLLALQQANVKRILAYSSIAHLGYLLVALLAGGELAAPAVTYYLVAYVITTLCAFGVVAVLSGPERDADLLEDYRGLFWRRPWLAGTFTAALLSLAGIPLTAGFVGKFYVLAAGVGQALWLLVLALVSSSVIGLVYYLRIIVTMYLQPEAEAPPAILVPRSLGGNVVLSALAVLLVLLGAYPAPVIDAILSITGALAGGVALRER